MSDARTVRIAPGEVASCWDALVEATRRGQRVVIEQDGEVIAALVPGNEYAALVRASDSAGGDGGRAVDGMARDDALSDNGSLDEDAVDRDVAAALEAVRAETRARDRALFERFGDLADEELVNVVANAVRAARADLTGPPSPATSG